MNDDELLRKLAQIERESRTEPEWDEVLAGRRDVSEVVEQLLAEGKDPDEVHAMAEAFTPTDDAQIEAWTRLLLEPSEAEPADPPNPEHPPIDLAPRRGPRRRRLTAIVISVAAAAMLVLWLPRVVLDPSVEPLPRYHFTIRNDPVDPMRGDDDGARDEPDRYLPHSMIHWMFNPERPVDESLELAVIIEGDDGQQCLARPEVHGVHPDGVFELRGPLQEVLGLEPGRWRLSFVVAPWGTLPLEEPGRCRQPRSFPCPCPWGRPSATAEAEHPTDPSPRHASDRAPAWIDSYEIVVLASET